jgi:hypothetical protein
VSEPHRAHERVVDDPVTSPRPAHLVPAPEAAEVRALHEQLPDQGSQVGGVRIAARDRAELGDAAAGLLLPVGPQLTRFRAQERVPDRVALPRRPAEQARMHPRPAGIGREDVVGPADHVGRAGAQGLEQQRRGRAPGARRRLRRDRGPAGRLGRQGLQVLVLVPVEAHGLGQRVDDRGARPGLPAPLEPGVVVDAHPGQRRDLLAPQPGRAPRAGAGRQPGVLRADAFPPGPQEPAELSGGPLCCHFSILPMSRAGLGPYCSPAPRTPEPSRCPGETRSAPGTLTAAGSAL